MAAGHAPREADTSAASPLLLAASLSTSHLCVGVVVVFEVARGTTAGTLSLSDRLLLARLLRLTAVILQKHVHVLHVSRLHRHRSPPYSLSNVDREFLAWLKQPKLLRSSRERSTEI